MMRAGFFIFALFLMMTGMAGVSFADDTPERGAAAQKEDAPEEMTEEAKLRAANPYIEPLAEKALALVDALGKEEMRVIYEIRNSFGITRSVRVVHGDVKKAVTGCGEESPEMKEAIDAAFSAWEKDVIGAVEQTEAKMEEVIKTQTVRPAKQIKEYLDLTKQAADFSEEQIDKQPLTTEGACKRLMESMDDTKAVLTELIAEIEFTPLEAADEAADEAAKKTEEKADE